MTNDRRTEALFAKYGDDLWRLQDRSCRTFPDAGDPRSKSGLLFPKFSPKFSFDFEAITAFTVGSCFARNVEQILTLLGVELPTMSFSAPKSEWPGRPNGLLNEFNPGTMSQRILFALNAAQFPEETIVPFGELYMDLLLPGGCPTTFERAIDRRAEIARIYSNLSRSNLLIVTLGLTEAWFDHETKLYLNQMPPHSFAKGCPGRYEFQRLDTSTVCSLLEEAFSALAGNDVKILLTVSPVPLQLSFTGIDCITANELSKSTLRVAAGVLAGSNYTDYFPSYEIVRSGGLAAYEDDHVHVREEIVSEVIGYMVDCFT